ncbi:MAG: cobalamin biosynthesis protein [Rhizobiaceae bacterium]|nr:cobalamin biosynthesis protein [Rhizobiaceae bacterium]
MGLLTLALLIDIFVGDPDWAWRRVSHPVVWIGRLIDWFDQLRDREAVQRFAERLGINGRDSLEMIVGGVLLGVFLLISLVLGKLISSLGWIGWILELAIVVVLLAQKSLYDHVSRVAQAFRTLGLSGARTAVAQIVGRDVSKLDESGVCKAAIESLAENFSDGVVAPALWYAIAGLPGLIFYKAVNTADSMIGHHDERFEFFGKPAAKLDDWLNWPAARLSTILVVISVAAARGSRAAGNVWSATLRDARSHRSPNAGWPETSFAAALNLSLGGPRSYGSDRVEAEFLYWEGRDIARPADIEKSLSLFLRCCICLIGFCGLLWLFFG